MSTNIAVKGYREVFVLAALFFVGALFLYMIKDLWMPVVLAATFGGLLCPWRLWLQKKLGDRRAAATIIVYVLALVIIGIPLLGVLTVSAKQAIQVSDSVIPHIKEYMAQPAEQWMESIVNAPLIRELKPFHAKIIEGLSQLAQVITKHFSQFFTSAAVGTVDFIFKLFIGLFALFFFLRDGETIPQKAAEYTPLNTEEVDDVFDKGVLIIQATMKSLFVIGVIQGALVSLAFWVLGIDAPVFWGVMVALFSAIPGLGAPLVWIPAVIYLVFMDRFLGAIGLTLWGVLVVGLVDNFLRPILIGNDVKLPQLYILLSILGGLATLGISGIILGPVLASVLISVLEIYRKVFQPLLSPSEAKKSSRIPKHRP